jgi:hypothetical protein
VEIEASKEICMKNRDAEETLLKAFKAVQDTVRAPLPYEPHNSQGTRLIKLYTPFGSLTIKEDGKVIIDTREIATEDDIGSVSRRPERVEIGVLPHEDRSMSAESEEELAIEMD